MNPSLRVGNRSIPVQVIGHDPVSRLGFLKVEGPPPIKPIIWLKEADISADTPLHAMAPGGSIQCQSAGWVKQVGGKILPLALLRVNFDQAVPPSGTALLDQSGRVVGIVFQSSGIGNAAYAIPAEAVHRVRRDICNGGRLVRGWLGLSLRAENPSPQVVRVLPKSPAAAAGIQAGDLLLTIGSHPVTDYADAANAFFYLIPDQPVRVQLRRRTEQLAFTLTPTRPQAE